MRVAFTVALLTLGASTADAFCYQPTEPHCATRIGSFSDQFEFDRCRREMGTYRDEIEEMIRCLQRSYSDAVDGFNRRARS